MGIDTTWTYPIIIDPISIYLFFSAALKEYGYDDDKMNKEAIQRALRNAVDWDGCRAARKKLFPEWLTSIYLSFIYYKLVLVWNFYFYYDKIILVCFPIIFFFDG